MDVRLTAPSLSSTVAAELNQDSAGRRLADHVTHRLARIEHWRNSRTRT